MNLQPLKFRWVRTLSKSQLFKWHFIDITSKTTYCGLKIAIDESSIRNSHLDLKNTCNNCIKILSASHGDHWKPRLSRSQKIKSPKKSHKPSHISYHLVEVICSDETCKEKGVAYIREDEQVNSNPHYCIKHNLKIQEALK